MRGCLAKGRIEDLLNHKESTYTRDGGGSEPIAPTITAF